jgi:phosphoribosylformimino-5-aminoimidazole carboxamide ribotide isomerase
VPAKKSAALKIIPVLDLKGGLIVRAVAGRRAEYRPIASSLGCDARPESVAKTFAALAFDLAYVADLDAIAGAAPAWNIYDELLSCGLQLWIDAGIGGSERATQMRDFADSRRTASGIVVGLESLASPDLLAEIIKILGTRRSIFSLDLCDGRPLAGDAWDRLTADEIVAIAASAGVGRAIVLDLARVGLGDGVGTLELCRRLHQQLPELELIAGGGVRGHGDLEALAATGCHAALVASALHDGRLTAADCR